MLIVFGLSASAAQTSRRESASSYLERGNQWLQKGEVERAMEDFTFAVSFDPTLDQAYFNRGIARERKGDTEKRLAKF
jgi:Tfp pilus assembly protein PilF